MTVLLWVIILEVPIVAAVIVFAVHRILLAHQTVLAAVMGHHARNFADELRAAEARVSEVARTGRVARGGPARLRD